MKRRSSSHLYKRVKNVMKAYPATRNSDIALTLQLWRSFHQSSLVESKRDGQTYVRIEKLFDLPREDHVKRWRAKIQNEERILLPTDPKILIERAKLSKDWKEALGYKTGWQHRHFAEAISSYLEGHQEPLF